MMNELSNQALVLALLVGMTGCSDSSSSPGGAAGQGAGASGGNQSGGSGGTPAGGSSAGAAAGAGGSAGSGGAAGANPGWQRFGQPLLTAGVPVGSEVELVIADVDVHVASDGTWRLYYNGPSAPTYVSDEITGRVVLATSPDGRSWTRVGPVIGDPQDASAWDSIRTETPSVVEVPSNPPARRFVMAYSGAAGDAALGFPEYQIGIAFSADGTSFDRLPAGESAHGEAGYAYNVSDALGSLPGIAGGVVADPELVLADGVLHLFHSTAGWDANNNILAFGIGHATSSDGATWTLVDAPVPSLLNSSGVGGQQPSVAFNSRTGLWEMVFTDDRDDERATMPSTFNPSMGVWMATSPDLLIWTVDRSARTFAWDASAAGETLGLLTGAELVNHDGQRHLFYTGWGSENVPDGFLVPTHTGYEPAVINLLAAQRAQ